MPSSMRRCALLIVASHADQISLMQDVKKPSKSHHKHNSVANLMESASKMLKNGATPDVVDFTEATIAEVTDDVIPAINNASVSDQQGIYDFFRLFEDNEAALVSHNVLIHQINAEETSISGHHKTCRSLESTKCGEKQACDMELYRRWVAWTECEENFREIHNWIDGQFCVPGELIDGEWVGGVNGTLFAFRNRVVPYMDRYIIQKPLCDTAIDHYNHHIDTCDTKVTYLDTKSNECNALQSQLEGLACFHADVIREASFYAIRHAELVDDWNGHESIPGSRAYYLRKQNDRIQEFTTLSTVNCLLDRVHERNGRPCDEATDDLQVELSHCEEFKTTVDYSHLELVFPEVPALLPNCPNRHAVVGECQPVLQPFPCNSDFHQQEYAQLPVVPQAPFSETNPGCNAYPRCSPCMAASPTPPPVIAGMFGEGFATPAPAIAGMFGEGFDIGEQIGEGAPEGFEQLD